ncbi:chaperonin 10-like protein [Lipomyces oligophaga]|uniref:chaperonin 10-like protein n=1 Tax=Lipomyces oligophaga TaxID=45792 RepID=UPI0034CF0BEF
MASITLPKIQKALVISKIGQSAVQSRPVRLPTGREVLVKVHSVGLNHLDYVQMHFGMMVHQLPTVIGSDVGGTVVALGPDVVNPSEIKVGTRALVFGTNFFRQTDPDFGSYQEYVMTEDSYISPIPENIDFDTAATFPMGVWTAWAGLYTAGITLPLSESAIEFSETVKNENSSKALLIWGTGSSVGVSALQNAVEMGYKVYAIAKSDHHEELLKLGAYKVFDYKEQDVVDKIVETVKSDSGSLALRTALVAVKEATPTINIFSRLVSELNIDPSEFKIASAPRISDEDQKLADESGLSIKFVTAPDNYQEFFFWVYRKWLPPNLASGKFVATQKPRLVEGGLAGVDAGLKILQDYAVSGEKLVINV